MSKNNCQQFISLSLTPRLFQPLKVALSQLLAFFASFRKNLKPTWFLGTYAASQRTSGQEAKPPVYSLKNLLSGNPRNSGKFRASLHLHNATFTSRFKSPRLKLQIAPDQWRSGRQGTSNRHDSASSCLRVIDLFFVIQTALSMFFAWSLGLRDIFPAAGRSKSVSSSALSS